MNKHDHTRPERDADERDDEVGHGEDAAHEDDTRRALDELAADGSTDPRTEDPGALPLTEDPFERRTKRTTM